MGTTLDLVNERIAELQLLTDRMDETAKLLYPEDNLYALTVYDDTRKKLDKDVSISTTTSLPAIYANAVATALIDGEWQVKAEGKIPERQKTTLKSFAEDLLSQIDEYVLKNYGLSSLNVWNANHATVRSIVTGRLLCTMKDGKLNISYVPCDARWTPFVLNEWWAPRTKRTKSKILAEYGHRPGVDQALLASLSEKGLIEVVDFWDGKKNQVFVCQADNPAYTGTATIANTLKGEILFEQKNPFGYPPFPTATVSAGFMLRDNDYTKHEFEDIFQFSRLQYDQYNRNMSIMATMGMRALLGTYEREMKPENKTTQLPVGKPDEVQNVPEGGAVKLVPQPDENRAFVDGRDLANQELQMATISNAELADTTQNRTAVWLATQARLRQSRNRPRMECLQVFRQSLIKMAIKQIRTAGAESVTIGGEGLQRNYTPEKLGDPGTYRITCKILTQTKEEEIANIAEAAAAKSAGVPQAIIDRDIMQAQDPEEWESMRRKETFYQAEPSAMFFDMAVKLVNEADLLDDEDEYNAKKLEARQAAGTGVRMILSAAQQQAPTSVTTPGVEQPKGNANALAMMPNLGAGGL